MNLVTMQRLDDLASDAVHDLPRAAIFAAGREYLLTGQRGPFDRYLFDRELARLVEEARP